MSEDIKEQEIKFLKKELEQAFEEYKIAAKTLNEKAREHGFRVHMRQSSKNHMSHIDLVEDSHLHVSVNKPI